MIRESIEIFSWNEAETGYCLCHYGGTKASLLDEPFNALDKEGQEKLSEIIRDMRDKGSLILLSSHDKDELENLSDVIYLVDSGRFKLK